MPAAAGIEEFLALSLAFAQFSAYPISPANSSYYHRFIAKNVVESKQKLVD